MNCNIMVVKIGNRRDKSPDVQKVLAEFGCIIKVRLGLHDTEDACSDEGILILQLAGEKEEMRNLEKELNNVESVQAQMVILD